MNIQHHPSDDILFSHAAGRLEPGLTLVVAAHVQVCPQCRQRVGGFAAIGGALLEDSPPVALAPEAFGRVLARLHAPPPAALPARPVRQAALGFPPELTLPAVLAGCHIGRWLWISPGLHYSRVTLPWAPATNVMLLRVAANRAVITHSHAETELTQILHGGYSDATGQYGPGDLAQGDDMLLHQPRADEEGCLCLAALDGGLRLDGWLGRLQRRLGL